MSSLYDPNQRAMGARMIQPGSDPYGLPGAGVDPAMITNGLQGVGDPGLPSMGGPAQAGMGNVGGYAGGIDQAAPVAHGWSNPGVQAPPPAIAPGMVGKMGGVGGGMNGDTAGAGSGFATAMAQMGKEQGGAGQAQQAPSQGIARPHGYRNPPAQAPAGQTNDVATPKPKVTPLSGYINNGGGGWGGGL